MTYTKAHHARIVNQMLIRIVDESASLALGMWNPLFCADDASKDADKLLRDLREQIEHIERRVNAAADQNRES